MDQGLDVNTRGWTHRDRNGPGKLGCGGGVGCQPHRPTSSRRRCFSDDGPVLLVTRVQSLGIEFGVYSIQGLEFRF
jgi:hypothetical protein